MSSSAITMKSPIAITATTHNLSPNKKRVFEEAFRTLKPGGRLMVSDIVLLKELPEAIKNRAHPASCVRGAIMKDEYLETIEQVGFDDVRIIEERQYSFEDIVNNPNAKVVVADPSKNTQELKRMSELEGEAENGNQHTDAGNEKDLRQQGQAR